MKCQYCNADINDGSLFCNNCGQAVEETKSSKPEVNAFWQKENSRKQEEVIAQLFGLQQKASLIHDDIALGRKYKSKKHFFKMLLILLFISIAVLAYSIYKANDNYDVQFLSLYSASMLSIIFILIVAAYATMVIKKVGVGMFYPLIPIFGYFYMLYSILCGIKRLFVPLENDEAIYEKGLKAKLLELNLLRKEEKELKTGLSLIDKNIFQAPALQELKKPLVAEKKKTNGWQVSLVIFFVLTVAVFAVTYYFVPVIYKRVS